MIDIRLIRIIACVLIGYQLISFGFRNEVFGIPMVGMGLLIIIYGFSPRLAKSVINAIVKIATAPFKS